MLRPESPSLRRVLAATSVPAAMFVVGCLAGVYWKPHSGIVHAAPPDDQQKVFELRTYTTPEGKLDNLLARFRDHTMTIFQRHGMTSVAYWTPTDPPLQGHTLIYVIAHDSREAAKRNWEAFRSDPEWQRVSKESEVNGKIVSHVESVFMQPTDFSPLK